MKLAALACLSLAPVLAQATGSIAGRVTNSLTGEGVGGVEIRFLDRHSRVFKASTDASGNYRLDGLDDGDYRGEFAKEGFAGSHPYEFFHVASGFPARQDVQLDPWGGVSGRVLDEQGNPARSIPVQLNRIDAVTDDNGVFAFKNLAAGSYTLLAKPQPKIRTVDGVRVGAVATYYPASTDLSQAAPILVRKGSDVTGIELRLKSVPVYRVTGVVLAPSGKPVAAATVRLLGKPGTARERLIFSASMSGAGVASIIAGPGPEPEIAQVKSGQDGTFEFPAVEPGDWRLSATLGEDDETPLGGVAPALVSVRDVEGVDLRLEAPFAVGVTWQWPDPQAPAALAPNAQIVMMLSPMESQPQMALDLENDVGQLRGLFPGRYRVMSFNFPRGYYPAAVMWGGRDVRGQVIDLAPGAPPLQVIYAAGAGTLRGTVDKGEGATVMLTPSDPGETINIRSELCGPGGAFEFANVIPGAYYVVAFDRRETSGLPVAEIPSSIIPIATGVRIESGATASVELRLNRWPW
jgi:hypothetical protein